MSNDELLPAPLPREVHEAYGVAMAAYDELRSALEELTAPSLLWVFFHPVTHARRLDVLCDALARASDAQIELNRRQQDYLIELSES